MTQLSHPVVILDNPWKVAVIHSSVICLCGCFQFFLLQQLMLWRRSLSSLPVSPLLASFAFVCIDSTSHLHLDYMMRLPRACACACVCVCVHACMHACLCVCVCVRECENRRLHPRLFKIDRFVTVIVFTFCIHTFHSLDFQTIKPKAQQSWKPYFCLWQVHLIASSILFCQV